MTRLIDFINYMQIPCQPRTLSKLISLGGPNKQKNCDFAVYWEKVVLRRTLTRYNTKPNWWTIAENCLNAALNEYGSTSV